MQGRQFSVDEITSMFAVYRELTVLGEEGTGFYERQDMVERYGPRAVTFRMTMLHIWNDTALQEVEDKEGEGLVARRGRVPDIKVGLSKEGYDRSTYKLNQTKIAQRDKVAAEKEEKKREANRKWHRVQKEKVAAMDNKMSNSDVPSKKIKTAGVGGVKKPRGSSKSLESSRWVRALRDAKIASGDPKAIESK